MAWSGTVNESLAQLNPLDTLSALRDLCWQEELPWQILKHST